MITDAVLRAPVIATGRGGSGTRLLSSMLADAGVFLGNELNVSMDSTEWVELIYSTSIQQLLSGSAQDTVWQQALLDKANHILTRGAESGVWKPDQPWGWKLPETMLILPQLFGIFDNARLIHLVRHPVDTCLRRTHITSRTNNPVGMAVLTAAYADLGWPPSRIHDDPEYIHNAVSWRYQVGRVASFARHAIPADCYLEVKYEDMCREPNASSCIIAGFLGLRAKPHCSDVHIDTARMRQWQKRDGRIDEVWDICEPVARMIGYAPVEPLE